MSHMPSGEPLAHDVFTSITPAALPAGSTDDYQPVDAITGEGHSHIDIIRQASNAAGSTITGLVVTRPGDYVIIDNLGPAGAITIAHDSSSSVGANRFTCPDGADFEIAVGAAAWFVYDAATARWRTASVTGAPGGGGGGATDIFNLGFGVAPAALAATPTETTDWDPWSAGTRYTLVRVTTATAGSILKSLDGGTQGDVVILENHGDGSGGYGAGILKIRHNKTGTVGITPGNNIYCPNLTDLIVPYTGSAILYYDSPSIGWIMLGLATGNRHERLVFHEASIADPLTPSVLAAGETHDYDPAGGLFGAGQRASSWLRLQANASGSILTGLVPYYESVGSQGPIKLITCLGNPLTLAHEQGPTGSSAAGNRFAFPGGKDLLLLAGQSVLLVYDVQGGGTLSAARWRLFGSSGGAFSSLTLPVHETSTLGATENNWSPPNWRSTGVHRVIPAPTTITGMLEIEQGAVRTITSYNVGLTISHQNVGSSTRNQFYCPGAASFVLNAGESATFRHDTSFGAWFCIGWTK
jgi:hypothetical protein